KLSRSRGPRGGAGELVMTRRYTSERTSGPRYIGRMASTGSRPLDRAMRFCAGHGLEIPIILAPMASACPVSLSIAVANAGGMGAMGALVTPPAGIRAWVQEFRSKIRGAFTMNFGFRIH